MPSVPTSAICATCKYSLRGLSNNRCPECGNPFDPDDPRSYSTPSCWWQRRGRVLGVLAITYLLFSFFFPGFGVIARCAGPLPLLLHSSSIYWYGMHWIIVSVGLILAYLAYPSRFTVFLAVMGFTGWFFGSDFASYVAARVG